MAYIQVNGIDAYYSELSAAQSPCHLQRHAQLERR
jgi:hypothetical protein